MPDTHIAAAEADTDTDGEVSTAPAGGGLLKKLLFGGGALLLLALGLFAGPVIQKMMHPAATTAAAVEEPAVAELPAPDPGKPAIYTALYPALVVNFQDATGDAHYMQIEMEIMTRDQKVVDAVKQHNSVIRNNLILLYGNVEYEAIRSRAGKEQMLADGLREVQAVLSQRIGTPGVEALYFTSLIIQ
jgi:flagellar FliL protein